MEQEKRKQEKMAYYSANDDLTFTALSMDREAELFRIFYSGKGKKSRAARDTIIQHHLKLVAKQAIALAKRSIADDDAISAGNAGLMQALERRKFVPGGNSRFSTYLRNFVRGKVFQAVRDSRLVYDPGFSDGTVTVAPTAAPVEELSEDHAFAEEELSRVRVAAIAKALKRLNTLEALTIRRVQLEGWTFEEVAKSRKVSRQACQQAHARGLKKLSTILSPLRTELL